MAVGVGACFHIHPDDGALLLLRDDAFQIFETEFRGEVEAKLGQLHRNFGVHPGVMDAAQNFQVVLRYLLGFGAIGDVLSQIGEYAADIALRQRLGGGQRGIQGFARHEARDAAAHERIVHRILA